MFVSTVCRERESESESERVKRAREGERKV